MLSPLLLLALLHAPSNAPAVHAQEPELDLVHEIRAGVRWLRSRQDPESGAYGDGVAATAWALRAFAECPDAYRPADGPFVRGALAFLTAHQAKDGAVADEGATESERLRQTRLAARALAELADHGGAEPWARALAFLGERGLEGPGWEEPAELQSNAAARARAVEVLAARGPEGTWDGPEGRLVATARALVELSRCEQRLARGRTPSAAAGAVRELPEFSPAEREAAIEAMREGAAFLAAQAQDGRFGGPGGADPGITAMVLAALQGVPAPRAEPVQRAVDRGLAWLVSLQREDGSIHDGRLASYTTSATILALVRSGDPAYADVIRRAQAYLQGLQLDEGEGYSEGDLYYGGIGYGSTERPDLSNLSMALEALAASELDQESPTYTKALRFLEHCQNRSESNDVRIVDGALTIVSGDDGGAGYMPGDSKAGFVELGDGTKVPRSYGSMTYALLKCFVFAGLERDDPRVRAAWEWVREHYTLDVNPGFLASVDPSAAYQGLFYYFYTMARALDAYGVEVVPDAEGREHRWRAELCGRLLAMQSKIDGSWVNRNSPRWWEGNPVLATAYALLTLDAAAPE